jgi:hypothetical protein
MSAELVLVVRCPHCGHEREETMPTDACQIRSTCEPCGGGIASHSRRLLHLLLVWFGALLAGAGGGHARAPLALSPEIRRWHAWRV